MGKPAFLYCDYAEAASVTAQDSLSGTDPNNVLLATEDTVWTPSNSVAHKWIIIDLLSPMAFDHTVFLGENLDGLQVITTTSNDNFVTDEKFDLQENEVSNGDFATGDLTDWDITTEVNSIISASTSGLSVEATAISGVTGEIEQDIGLIPEQWYLCVFTVTSIGAGLKVGMRLGDVATTTLSAAGTHTQMLKSTVPGTVNISVFSAGNTIIGNTAIVTDVQVYAPIVLESINNAAILQHLTTSTDRYIQYIITNPSTSLQIAHICPDTLVELPWMAEDWGSEGVAPVFKNLISTGGGFLGNNQIRTMRDININFGEVTDTEYDTLVKPWVDSRVKIAKPFYFLPDVDNLDEIYFVWLEDNVGFVGPLKQGVRTVAPIKAKTRIA